jgi:hypothetical protein
MAELAGQIEKRVMREDTWRESMFENMKYRRCFESGFHRH